MMRADPFQTFMRTNATALGKVFTPAEVNSLQAIAADIARSKRSQAALKLPGGSNSPQDFHAAGLLHDVGHGGLSVIGTLLGETMGEHLAGGWVVRSAAP